MIGPLTYLDAALVALAALSGLLAMYRGLTREILSILSWIVAGAAVAYFILYHRPVAVDIAEQIGAPIQVAQVAVGAVLFVIILVIVHLITSKISDAILDSNIGMIDRILGLIFGVVRGFILIVIPFMLYENFFPEPETAAALGSQCRNASLYQGYREDIAVDAGPLHSRKDHEPRCT